MDDNQPTAAPQAADQPQELTVDEFCMRRSVSDRRVELLAAFHQNEIRNQRHKDVESAYAARLDTFASQPVA